MWLRRLLLLLLRQEAEGVCPQGLLVKTKEVVVAAAPDDDLVPEATLVVLVASRLTKLSCVAG